MGEIKAVVSNEGSNEGCDRFQGCATMRAAT